MVPVCFLYLHWFISLPLSLSLYFSGCCSHSDYIAFSDTFLFQVCTFLFQMEIKIRYSRNPKDARYALLKRHCCNVWYWGCTVSVWCHRQKWGGRAGRAFKTSFKKDVHKTQQVWWQTHGEVGGKAFLFLNLLAGSPDLPPCPGVTWPGVTCSACPQPGVTCPPAAHCLSLPLHPLEMHL